MDTPRPKIIHWIPWKIGDPIIRKSGLIVALYRSGISAYFKDRVRNSSGESLMYAVVSIPMLIGGPL